MILSISNPSNIGTIKGERNKGAKRDRHANSKCSSKSIVCVFACVWVCAIKLKPLTANIKEEQKPMNQPTVVTMVVLLLKQSCEGIKHLIYYVTAINNYIVTQQF